MIQSIGHVVSMRGDKDVCGHFRFAQGPVVTFHHWSCVRTPETAAGQLAKWLLNLRINNGVTVTMSVQSPASFRNQKMNLERLGSLILFGN